MPVPSLFIAGLVFIAGFIFSAGSFIAAFWGLLYPLQGNAWLVSSFTGRFLPLFAPS
jgi:hypothetical protein